MSSTKLFMTLLIRDEEDIIEQNITYHLNQGVDFIYAIDNGSIDSTPKILERFVRDGRLSFESIDEYTYEQAKWVSSMAKKSVFSGATHLIHADADEFWVPKRGNLKSELPDKGEIHLVRRLHYIPPSIRSPQTLPIDFNSFKFYIPSGLKENEKGSIDKEKIMFHASPYKIITTAENTDVSYGNHDVISKTKLEKIVNENINIHHFPTRSFEQFKHKVQISGEALERNPEKGVGTHMRKFYTELQNGEFEETYKNM